MEEVAERMQNGDSAADQPDERDSSARSASEPGADQPSARAGRERRPGKRKPKLPRTEAEIDSPKPLTLVLLGAMSLLTLALWGSARVACNERSPLAKK